LQIGFAKNVQLINRYRNYQTSGHAYESDYLSGNDGAQQVTYTTTTTTTTASFFANVDYIIIIYAIGIWNGNFLLMLLFKTVGNGTNSFTYL